MNPIKYMAWEVYYFLKYRICLAHKGGFHSKVDELKSYEVLLLKVRHLVLNKFFNVFL